MVSRAPEETYLYLHLNNTTTKMMREEPSGRRTPQSSNVTEKHDEPVKVEGYVKDRSTPSSSPSPPREYIYGVRRQRDWSGFSRPAQSNTNYDPDQDYNPFPEEDDPYYDEGGFVIPSNEKEEYEKEQQRLYDEERRWQQELAAASEEDRRRWEAEERYRRWEAEELRRYEEEHRRRRQDQQQDRRQREEYERLQQRRREEERREEEKRVRRQREEHERLQRRREDERREEERRQREEYERLQRQHQERMRRSQERRSMEERRSGIPTFIPKPPPPALPEFRQSHNPRYWESVKEERPHHSSDKVRYDNSDQKISYATEKASDHSNISKDSWVPPYEYYSSEHSERKPLHMCKTAGSEDSYHGGDLKSPPAYLTKEAPRDLVKPEPAPKQVMVEIQPGFSLPLRGSKDTLDAVARGHVLNAACMVCSFCVVVRDDCDFVICPECRVVSPVEGGPGTMEYVGLGMARSVHDASVARYHY